jgi:hypothetical protein
MVKVPLLPAMRPSLAQGSGTVIITARGSGMPFIIRNSRVLSSMAESEPEASHHRQDLVHVFLHQGERMVSSRASMRSMLPRMVLISPLCMI